MTDIDAIAKLYAKTKTYKIPKEPREGREQITIDVTPLNLDDMSVLNMKDDMPMKELAENAKKLIGKSLGIKEEEAAKISFEFMEDILNAIMDANNFSEEDKKKTGIKGFIEKKRAQTEEQKKNEQSTGPA